MKTQINKGFTNISFRDGDVFIQQKMYNGFNHHLDYNLIQKFNFVPRLLEATNEYTKWEFIEGDEPVICLDNVELLAKQILEIHKSNIKFPPSNHAARIKKYRQDLKKFGRRVKVLDDFYRPVNQTLAKMSKNTPLHNDLWPFNMISKDNKIYFVDWEYACMGDKHFELAYVIEATRITGECEKLFLKTYGEYNPLFLLRHKILVNYLVVLWANAQENIPFDTTPFEQKIYELDKQLKEMY
ncbi:choline/ethanolamine kinase family protein LicA [Mycoplasmopsis californica]|uniref:Choline/ethanolamine kinase family protein LicA n=2 Tax=Mycoplasmopsis californica TaxID=2113 RepID=A0A059XWT2_9BACT|nr:phosphotransferase [Mycoplasmopsis californica]AIA29687.1 choline/ethanolamine kinase family protein LicA [Mycoplasmopsis californica]